jgi:hypothetical protein
LDDPSGQPANPNDVAEVAAFFRAALARIEG